VQSALSKSKNKEKAVNNNCGKKFWGGGPARSIISGLLVAAAALAVTGIASAQDKTNEIASFNLLPNPTTPPAITPPAGNVLFLAGHRVGSHMFGQYLHRFHPLFELVLPEKRNSVSLSVSFEF
jgi:hypothetical protein